LHNTETGKAELNQRIQSHTSFATDLERQLEAITGESERYQRIAENLQSNLEESGKNRQLLEEANKRLAEFEHRERKRKTRSFELIKEITDRVERLRDNVQAIPETTTN